MASPKEKKRTDNPRTLPISSLSLAYASLILLNKPIELSATEFILYLRGCIQKDGAPPPRERLPVSNESYWRNLCEDKDTQLLQLNQKLINANLENEKLTQLVKKRKASDGEEPGSKRVKGTHGAIVTHTIQTEDRLVQWEPIQETYNSISSGNENIFLILRSLHYAKDAKSIGLYLVRLCDIMSLKIRSLCKGDKETRPDPKENSTQQGRRTRQSEAAAVKQKFLDTVWVNEANNAIDEIFRRLFTGIRKLSILIKNSEAPTIQSSVANVVDAVSDLFCSIIESIHSASLSFNNENPNPRTRDIRNGCFRTIQSFTSALNGTEELEATILEAIIYIIVESAGKCLCVRKTVKYPNGDAKLQEILSLEETSIHVLRLLKFTLPLYREQLVNSSIRCGSDGVQNPSPVLELAKHRFHEYVMRGLFGDTKTPEWTDLREYGKEIPKVNGGESWGGVGIETDFEFIEEGFAEEVWKLLELEDFTLVCLTT
ncbi:hypothetical protein H072_8950 [Dactylellina haptotyla CBS 200.50]|uniref:Uncharacterized protein n=1 Tax=Dactylellina haptotyla (strain CBS 200.50) TaxID=1284197 RepID=S8A3R0_DACHA|nr:hypothetical protein H072_8950 [Dactylellina haptotyla CBS 200.50]